MRAAAVLLASFGLFGAATAGAATPPPTTLVLPVIEYHRVGPVKPSLPAITQRLTVDPQRFEAEMQWLKAHGYHAVTEQQAWAGLEHGAPLPPHPVLITFDDGYRDVLWHAAPVLHRLHMHGTVFIITDRISNGDPSFFTWPQLARLQRLGFDVEAHTVTHADLPSLSNAVALRELTVSKRQLESHLHRKVIALAYPAGRYDARIEALARRAGYRLGMTEVPGIVQYRSQPLALRRLEILDTTTVSQFAALVRNG